MKQVATVKRILGNGKAEVSVKRQSACGHNCSDCHGCEQLKTAELVVAAENRVHANCGDIVIVESGNATILTAAAVVLFFFKPNTPEPGLRFNASRVLRQVKNAYIGRYLQLIYRMNKENFFCSFSN